MKASHSLDRLRVAFDDPSLVANAGLLLPATLAEHLGLGELVRTMLDLGGVPGSANVGGKAMTVVASLLAGGDCIDDVDVLRAGGSDVVIGGHAYAPSTIGTFLRAFTWGHVRQLDAVCGAVMERAWRGGAGPGAADLTVDVDSSVCETYGLQKQGALGFTYKKNRGYHPLFAVAAGTADVLHSRLRGGSSYTGRGAGSFVSETIRRARRAGATGRITLRADSGFYNHKVVDACRREHTRFSITAKVTRKLHTVIGAIPEEAWTTIPYWLDDGADVAEARYIPFAGRRGAKEVRLIVRRVRPTPGSQLSLDGILFTHHAFITDRDGPTLELEADHRRHAEVENAIRDLKYGVGLNHLPSGRFAANGAWLAFNVLAHNLARWTSRIGLGETLVGTKTLRHRHFSLPGRIANTARRLHLHLPTAWPWAAEFLTALERLRSLAWPATAPA